MYIVYIKLAKWKWIIGMLLATFAYCQRHRQKHIADDILVEKRDLASFIWVSPRYTFNRLFWDALVVSLSSILVVVAVIVILIVVIVVFVMRRKRSR